MIRIRAVALAAATAMVLCGCGGGGGGAGGGGSSSSSPTPVARPSSPAQVTILAPKNGQVVHGSTVHLRLSLKKARIVPSTTRNIRPDQGHVHVYLDNKVVSMTYGLTQAIGNVKPGNHVVRVEFVASDHLPFDPRVFTAVTFEVKK